MGGDAPRGNDRQWHRRELRRRGSPPRFSAGTCSSRRASRSRFFEPVSVGADEVLVDILIAPFWFCRVLANAARCNACQFGGLARVLRPPARSRELAPQLLLSRVGRGRRAQIRLRAGAAYNDYQIEHWLESDARLRGSVHVVGHTPQDAPHDIDRVAEHPQIVQVFLPTVTDREYGDPYYHPIYEAAQRNGLAVTFHHGTHTRAAQFGFPRY